MENKNKKVLIIPDIHNRWQKAERIILTEGFDKLIFLGDFFDSFHDNPEINRQTAIWLKKYLHDPNVVTIFGNHDISYCKSNRCVRCSGYTNEKDSAINSILTYEDWDKFVWYHISHGYLFTHAGLDQRHLPPVNFKVNLKNIDEFLKKSISQAKINLACNKNHWIYAAGFTRYGNVPVGGIDWVDFLEEFDPIEETAQIFGHTFVKNPTFLRDGTFLSSLSIQEIKKYPCVWESEFKDWNLNLDTVNNYYATIENNKLIIKAYADIVWHDIDNFTKL